MNLSDNLKKIRKDNNLSQEDLAEKLGVSRQSVSKWESGLAYPEMDKVLELCKIFNLNIDDLLNQDIKEVENNKQSISTVNKYIDSFLSYISKTVNLFSSLKFKDKIKCIIEQLIICFILIMASIVLKELLVESVIYNIFSFLPDNVFYVIRNLFDGLFILIAFIVSISIILHVFKVRYLDYYVVVDKEEKNETTEEQKEDKNEKEVVKEPVKEVKRKEEKIIIRDPEHSGYKFINGLVKVILFFIKCFVFFIGIGFACSLVFLVACLVLSFIIKSTGLLFIGALLALSGSIIINLVILDIIISFILNRKTKKGLLVISLLISLIMIGVGSGLAITSFKNVRIVKDYDEKYFVTDEEHFKMTNDLTIAPYNDQEFIESKNDDIRIEYIHPNYCNINYNNYDNEIYYYIRCLEEPESFEHFLNNLNDKVIVDDNYYVKVYTNKNNIRILKENINKRIQHEREMSENEFEE